ncbi:MAG: xanthine dehydrogenase accessory protein XdhC [Pseudomonadota bacterium]
MISSEDVGLFATAQPCVLVRVVATAGSAPRGVDAFMLVSRSECLGTIGGGQLEYLAIDHARQILAGKGGNTHESVALGPDIGQCCGGRVNLSFDVAEGSALTALLNEMDADETSRPAVYVFGGGHVGRALCKVLDGLPVATYLVETRPDAPAMALDLPRLSKRVTAIPEEVISGAPAGSVFVVLTHDHALDFLIAAKALTRADAAYVGMIGSATKRAKFNGWLKQEGRAPARDLVCPMAPAASADKRPEVLAVHFAAEIMAAITAHQTQLETRLVADPAH